MRQEAFWTRWLQRGGGRNAKWLLPALCASAPGSLARPWTLGSVGVAHVGAGGVRVKPATAVTARAEEPELRSLRPHFGHIATEELGHLVEGCAASETFPEIVQVHRGPGLPGVHVHRHGSSGPRVSIGT
jgi:hypothetical protein